MSADPGIPVDNTSERTPRLLPKNPRQLVVFHAAPFSGLDSAEQECLAPRRSPSPVTLARSLLTNEPKWRGGGAALRQRPLFAFGGVLAGMLVLYVTGLAIK